MPYFPFLMGAAFKNQTDRGIATTMETIGNGAAIDNTTDGAVLGDPNAGDGGTGISITFGKNISEKAVQTGSFTRDFANYVGRTVDAFSIAIPLKGNGNTTTTPVAADFTPDVGIAALWRAAGLSGGASGATWAFTPAATALVTGAVYIGGEGGDDGYRVIVRDVEASGVTLDFTPGEVATAAFNLTGVFDELTAPATWDATPFNYGNQSTLSAPAVQNVTFAWLARDFGFSSLSIAIDNESEVLLSSNTIGGTVPRQTGRTITITGTIDATDADVDYELTQLAASAIGSAQQLTFTVGTAAGAAQTANAYTIDVPDPELISVKPVKGGNTQYYELTWIARGATANSEFSLVYK